MSNEIEILERHFDRIAERTDAAFDVLLEGEGGSRAEKVYQDWAALLLRYQAALDKARGERPQGGPAASMKGDLDSAKEAIPSVPTTDTARTDTPPPVRERGTDAAGDSRNDVPEREPHGPDSPGDAG